MARRMEADVVGHHQASEAIYARELGIHFAALSYVTNIAAGLADPGGQGALGWQGTASGFARSTEILLEAVVLAARRQVKCEICAAARNPPVWKRGSEVRLRPQFR